MILLNILNCNGGAYDRIFTIPNLLSLIRILLIPVFVALFFHDEMIGAALILILSGLTDTLDGYIAVTSI